jgi:hypothetical protein
MKPMGYRWWFWLIVFIWGGNLSTAYGDIRDHIEKFHPYLILQGEYDSNIGLTQNNTISDFITTISPGIKYLSESPVHKFDLDFRIGAYLYAQDSGFNYIGYRGTLDTSYSFNPGWKFKLLDTLDRSRNTVNSYSLSTPTGNVATTNYNVGGNLFIQNIFQPEIEYKFAPDSFVSMYYRNQIYREDDATSDSQNSTGNTISPRLDYWFNIHHGLSFDYAYINAQFETRPDWVGNSMAGRYLYRFNPRTTIIGELRYLIIDNESSAPDYAITGPSVYLDHAFSPTLSGRARLGWFWQQYSGNISSKGSGNTFSNVNGPVFYLGVSQRGLKTTYSLSFDGGYRFDYFTSSNQGFAKYYQAQANVTYQLMQRLSLGLTGLAALDEYELPKDTQYNYQLVGNISYQPLKWLTIALEAGNYGRNSDINGNSYRNNRAMLTFSGTY